jgi:hypothetical protein
MRRTLTACRSGLSLAAAVVLLTACGGSDEEESASSTASSSSTAESNADAAGSEFCSEAGSIEERLNTTIQGSADPESLPQALQEAADEIRSIQPPDEIASDWNALADGVEQVAAAVAQVDFSDPKALETFEQQIGELESELFSASTNVENYLREECGIDATETESAAPSS